MSAIKISPYFLTKVVKFVPRPPLNDNLMHMLNKLSSNDNQMDMLEIYNKYESLKRFPLLIWLVRNA